VQRLTVIKVKAQDADGRKVQRTLEGWEARVFQHEFDHLDGVLFPHRMSSAQLEREAVKLRALEDAFAVGHGSVPFRSCLEHTGAVGFA
jgi:peptide deformylase